MPSLTLVYGLLGLVPFLVPPVAGFLFPAIKNDAALVLAVYGGLILSFLGGARFGFAHARTPLAAATVSISMLPTIAGLALLAAPVPATPRLLGLAVALALHWLWDVRSGDLPRWYPRLRTILTTGAVAGLLAGAFVLE
jgi:hypothetical protein